MKRVISTALIVIFSSTIASMGCKDSSGSGSSNAESGVQLGMVSSELIAVSAFAGDGNGPAFATVSDQEVPESGFPATDANGTTFNIDMARGYVRDVELDLPDGTLCGQFEEGVFSDPVSCVSATEPAEGEERGKDKIVVAGPFDVDLVNGTSSPSLDNVGIPSGAYQRIDIRFEEADALEDGLVAVDDALNGNTIIMSGTFKMNPNDEDEPEKTFEMALTFTEDVRFEGPGTDIVLDENDAEDLVLKLDVAMWFITLPITTCINDGDLVIDETNHLVISDSGSGIEGDDCDQIEGALKEAMKTSGQLDKN